MDWQRKSLRIGTYALLLAVSVRLYSNGALKWVQDLFQSPNTAAAIFYLETGKIFRPVPAETAAPTEVTAAPTETPTLPEQGSPLFSSSDAPLVSVRDTAGCSVDIAALLEMPLSLNLTAEAPTVLILHTHATESYTQTEDETYAETSQYRTLDTGYNLVSIGNRLESLLTDRGIGVIHAETLHDYPSYDGGYDNSRATAETVLAQEPGIQLILDLHRDAAVDTYGNQFTTSCRINGREAAQILFVVGAGHPNWQENMALAVKLTALLEKKYPGSTRGIIIRSYDFNQDLSGGALLVEMGAAGDTREKALVAAEALAEVIAVLAQGTDQKK